MRSVAVGISVDSSVSADVVARVLGEVEDSLSLSLVVVADDPCVLVDEVPLDV